MFESYMEMERTGRKGRLWRRLFALVVVAALVFGLWWLSSGGHRATKTAPAAPATTTAAPAPAAPTPTPG